MYDKNSTRRNGKMFLLAGHTRAHNCYVAHIPNLYILEETVHKNVYTAVENNGKLSLKLLRLYVCIYACIWHCIHKLGNAARDYFN